MLQRETTKQSCVVKVCLDSFAMWRTTSTMIFYGGKSESSFQTVQNALTQFSDRQTPLLDTELKFCPSSVSDAESSTHCHGRFPVLLIGGLCLLTVRFSASGALCFHETLVGGCSLHFSHDVCLLQVQRFNIRNQRIVVQRFLCWNFFWSDQWDGGGSVRKCLRC